MTVADHYVVGEVGFAAWKSSDAFKGIDLDDDVIERARAAFESFAPDTEAKVYIAERGGEFLGWAAQDGAPNYVSDLWVAVGQRPTGLGKTSDSVVYCHLNRGGHGDHTQCAGR